MGRYPVELFHDVSVIIKDLEISCVTDLIISSIEMLARLEHEKNNSLLYYNELEEEIIKLSSSIESAIRRIYKKSQLIELGCQFLYVNPNTCCKVVLYLSKVIYDVMSDGIDTLVNEDYNSTRRCLQVISKELYRYNATGSTAWYSNGTRKPNQRFIALEDAINSLEYSVDTLERIKDEYVSNYGTSKDEVLNDYIRLLEDKIRTKRYIGTISSLNEFSISVVSQASNYLNIIDKLDTKGIVGADEKVGEYGRVLRGLLRTIGSAKIGD